MRFSSLGLTCALGAAAATLTAAMATGAAALEIGQSAPGQLDLQTPVTQVARQITDLHHFMLYIITGITAFVLALLAIVILRYNRAVNPTPARWSHYTPVEVVWTVAPIVILVAIAVPSVQLLRLQEDFSKVTPDIVVKATGHQWYWNYQYVNEGVEFDSLMLGKGKATLDDAVRAELAQYGYPETVWKLATDTALVVPVGKTVLVQSTAADVIHSWTVPAFGSKADGVPGRLNQTWFNAEKEGIYFGQCSELCGKDHSFMPITVKVVSQPIYDAWLACAQSGDVYTCPSITMIEPVATSDAGSASRLAAIAAPVAVAAPAAD